MRFIKCTLSTSEHLNTICRLSTQEDVYILLDDDQDISIDIPLLINGFVMVISMETANSLTPIYQHNIYNVDYLAKDELDIPNDNNKTPFEYELVNKKVIISITF